jgi:hypothetical protein
MDLDWRKRASMVVSCAVRIVGGVCGRCGGKCEERVGAKKDDLKMCQT